MKAVEMAWLLVDPLRGPGMGFSSVLLRGLVRGRGGWRWLLKRCNDQRDVAKPLRKPPRYQYRAVLPVWVVGC